MDEVPKIDEPEVETSGRAASDADKRHDELAFRNLDSEAKAKENINRDADQRHSLRIIAVVVSCFLILLFIFILFWIVLKLPVLATSEVSATLLVAMFVAPIAAMTTLAVSLMLAAFRGSKDGDERGAASLAVNGLKATGIGG